MDYQIKNIKDEILIIENVVPRSFQQNIIERIQGDAHFPWFLLHRIGHPDHYGPGTTPAYLDPNITIKLKYFKDVYKSNI